MDQQQTLEALTNQRIEITVGGLKYDARKATLKDFAAINKYRVAQLAAEDNANAELNVALFSLCLLLRPKWDLTPDQLSERIPLESIADLGNALEQLGFKSPQKEKTAQK